MWQQNTQEPSCFEYWGLTEGDYRNAEDCAEILQHLRWFVEEAVEDAKAAIVRYLLRHGASRAL
jgi:hypothetical protein